MSKTPTMGIDPLSNTHRQMLQEDSGISAKTIEQRRYRTVTTKAELARLGFAANQRLVPTLLIPIWGTGGEEVLLHHRPDAPRRATSGKPIKYEFPRGATMAIDVHPTIQEQVRDPKVPLFVTEGVKKADAAICRGLCCIGLVGVWNFRGQNEHGGLTTLPDWDGVALKGKDDKGNTFARTTYIVFDSDVMVKKPVQAALDRLAGFLKSRGANVAYIYLPNGPGGEKMGLDDYFVAGNNVDQLLHRATTERIVPPFENADLTELLPYEATEDGLFWNRPTADGVTPVRLTNFGARIIADTIEDDGAEERRYCTIQAMVRRQEFTFDLPAEQFSGMNWIIQHLGSQAMIFPGMAQRDHTRAAIQVLSGDIPTRRVRTHLGWVKASTGNWFYCHGGGAIGKASADGEEAIVVRLQDSLSRFCLPEPPVHTELHQAIHAVLKFWKMGKPETVLPTAAAALRAALGTADFSVFLSGSTGVFKSELAALAQQHFGASQDARHLPADWSATDNYLEGLAFTAKDTLLVIDEFVPRGGVHERERSHGKADRVLRAQGNNAARGRMRADGTLRPARPPRGLILSTGEEIPQGQSLRARIFVVEVSSGDIPTDTLTTCQADARKGLYAQAMAGFINWLAVDYQKRSEEVRQSIVRLRDEITQASHRRTPELTANLIVGIRYFLRFAVESGALEKGAGIEWFDWAKSVLIRSSLGQADIQQQNEPTRRYLELLAAAISSGAAHVAGMGGGEPKDPECWGWREVKVSSGGYTQPEWRAQGVRIGFVEDNSLYLLPQPAYQVVQKLASESGDGLGIKPFTLSKRLKEKGLLVTTDQVRQRSTIRVTASGTRIEAIHLSTLAVFPEQASQTSQTLQTTENP